MNHRPFARNIPLFIAFRVLFNARWYYPVLSVLFLDFGLTIEQYALLNVAWAAAIVGLEVPSGALADRVGRKRLIVFAAVLMVIEMGVFAFAPRGNATLLFALFFINRILSGAAEASASGADEALAYDSLAAEGRTAEWPQVLERVMRWQSIGFFVAMMLGSAVYDATFVQWAIDAVGLPWRAVHETTMRFPLYLTLGNAVVVLLVALSLREPAPSALAAKTDAHVETTWRATVAAGRWILRTPLALGVIVAGLCFDSIVRLFMTMTSNYYRVIALPDAAFGLIGSGFAVLGFFVPSLARRLVARGTRCGNFGLVAALVFVALLGIAQVWPISGLIWLVPLGVGMSLNQFFVSHYLNEAVNDSRRRATVLSFRGLAFNLAYGGVGLLFAALSRGLNGQGTQEAVFAKSLGWLPWYFVATVVLLAVAWRRIRF